MIKSLNVIIDQTTWPATGAPGFPAAFIPGLSKSNVPILPTLLLIGQLTTPPLARGVSLSEFWAWVRYLYAVSPNADLRISQDFACLDSHQKTILSDDFGMGIPIGYLIGKLSLVAWSDGRYFMDRMSALVSGPLPVPRKRGPRKAPDFVFMDNLGALHVVECKGGQSGTEARDRQLSHTNSKGQASGGVIQKHMVLLPAHLQGQRLACGLSLATAGKVGMSDLKIVDPVLHPEFDVSKVDDVTIHDPIARANLAKLLRGAGFGLAAAAVAAPSGVSARMRPSGALGRRARETRRTAIERRNAAARNELASPDVATFVVGETKLVGREVTMVLPIPLNIGPFTYRRVTIRQGVSPDLIGYALEQGLTEEPLPSAVGTEAKFGAIVLTDDGARAELRMGGSFVSEIILEKSASGDRVSVSPQS